MLRRLLILSFVLFQIACGDETSSNEGNIIRDDEGKIVSGEIKKYTVSGKLESVFNVANYKLNGPATKYYEDGVTPRSELIYKDGKLEGLQKR